MVLGICFNDKHNYFAALSFPQCDLEKYLMGLENLSAVFGDFKQENVSDLDQYHNAVFNFADELNGYAMPVRVNLKYEDFLEINENEYELKDGIRRNNPARKSTSPFPVRKLRMRVFEVFNGKSFSLEYEQEKDTWQIIGKYPILPWISNEGLKTFHTNPFDGKPRKVEDLFSEDALRRQDYLNIEFRIGEKPLVNRMAEYLDPEIYYDWVNSKELTKIKIETERLREECNRIRDEGNLREDELLLRIEELNNKYEEKAEEIRINTEKSAIGQNYYKIKENVDERLSEYEKETIRILGISETSILTKLDTGEKKLSDELKKQLYTSELTFRLLDDAADDDEPVDITIAVLPLTKSIELVLRELYDRIDDKELGDSSNNIFKKSNDKKIYFSLDTTKKCYLRKEGKKVEMWALTQLFNDQLINVDWNAWWNKNDKYMDLSLLEKFESFGELPQLEDGKTKSSNPAGFIKSGTEIIKTNRKILFQALNYIRDQYRNPIAHSTKLNKSDYEECRKILISGQKLFWILLAIIKKSDIQ